MHLAFLQFPPLCFRKSLFSRYPDTIPFSESSRTRVLGFFTVPTLAEPSQGGPPGVPDTTRGVGLFQEKPHSLQNNIRTSLEKKKRGSGVSWASRPEATLQGQWGMWTVWVGVSGCPGTRVWGSCRDNR